MSTDLQLKVMTYNVLYGFHERDGTTMIFREERARAAGELMRAQAADVVALTEGAYCGPGGRIVRQDYAAMLGLPHVACVGHEGEWGSVLVSRFPIAHVERLPLGRSPNGAPPSALRATLACGDRELHVDVVHPSPTVSERERIEAFAPVLATARTPGILLGDFNALSDEDDYQEATLVAQLRGNVPDPEALAARMLDRGLIASIRAAGLIDTLPVARRTHSLPTRLSRPGATQGAKLRIDYIFVSPGIRVLDAEILQPALADAVSDHYPVVATLGL
jgi:endonuclease/exonuclease/phosphatase family metal-dependent hydrolase